MSYKFEKKINGSLFLAPFKLEHKKYDVIAPNGKRFSFGDRRYEQYHDKIGYYKKLNHNIIKVILEEENSTGLFSIN